MISYILPLVTLLIGAILGLFSTMIAANVRHKQDITIKLLEHYLKVRDEIVSSICTLADKTLLDSFEADKMKIYRDTVAVMYYKYYDLLPVPILEALLLLNVCLTRLDGSLYKVENGGIIKMNKSDVLEFITICHDHKNGQYLAAAIFNGDNQKMKINQAVMLHTRHVFKSLSTFLPTREFLAMINPLHNGPRADSKRSWMLQLSGRHLLGPIRGAGLYYSRLRGILGELDTTRRTAGIGAASPPGRVLVKGRSPPRADPRSGYQVLD
jgi:hypothetical protein